MIKDNAVEKRPPSLAFRTGQIAAAASCFPMNPPACLFALALLLAACQPQNAPQRKAGADPRPGPPAVDDIQLEKRPDGLWYQTGAQQPFTGTDIEPDRKKAEEENRLGFIVVSPYENGLVHGTLKVYYPNGDLQEEVVYEKGARKLSTMYYTGGQKKHHVAFNARNLAEGPYTRWHKTGQPETVGTFDENEKYHGDHKIYDENGQLIGHYTMTHGVATEIHFETDEMKKHRAEKHFDQPPVQNPAP